MFYLMTQSTETRINDVGDTQAVLVLGRRSPKRRHSTFLLCMDKFEEPAPTPASQHRTFKPVSGYL